MPSTFDEIKARYGDAREVLYITRSTGKHVSASEDLSWIIGEVERLRTVASALLEVAMIDPAALTYGVKRRRAIEAAGELDIIVPNV